MNFKSDLQGIQWMFDQGHCNKVTAGTLDNNFDTSGLVSCHTKFGERGPASCSDRGTNEDRHGTLLETSPVS
jgi:hypothetical protein